MCAYVNAHVKRQSFEIHFFYFCVSLAPSESGLRLFVFLYLYFTSPLLCMLQRTPFLNSLQLLAAYLNILGAGGINIAGLDLQAREYFFHVVTVYSLKERSREVHVVFPKLGSGKSQTCHHMPDKGGLKQREMG